MLKCAVFGSIETVCQPSSHNKAPFLWGSSSFRSEEDTYFCCIDTRYSIRLCLPPRIFYRYLISFDATRARATHNRTSLLSSSLWQPSGAAERFPEEHRRHEPHETWCTLNTRHPTEPEGVTLPKLVHLKVSYRKATS